MFGAVSKLTSLSVDRQRERGRERDHENGVPGTRGVCCTPFVELG